MRRGAAALAAALLCSPAPALPGDDWPMWGGTPARNMASPAQGLATSWDVESGRNVRWRAPLGTQTYGNPVVAGGKVFVGTNNGRAREAERTERKEDKGVLLALRESDGSLLWRAATDKLDTDRDFPLIGVCGSPLVEGDRLYYVSNRGELVALDVEGFRDGENDGPFRGEASAGATDPDLVWRLDMPRELGVVPRFASANSPAVHEDLLYLNTSNGIGPEGKVAAPKAPSFLAVDKRTGKVVWSDASPGERILGGQWSSPAVAVAGGVPQVVFGGGDGWLYAFHALTREPLWRFDGNAAAGLPPANRAYFVATPVFAGDKVLVGLGRDPQDGDGPGGFWALDATKRGDITRSGTVWHYRALGRTLSTAAVADGLVYVADLRGILHCLDLATGRPHWTHDTFAAVWGSPLVADGRVYLADEDGDVEVLQAGKQRKLLATLGLGQAAYGTPVPANGVLYIAAASELFAFAPTLRPR